MKEVALLVSKEVNDKRRAKGLQPRPVRTVGGLYKLHYE